MTKSVRAPIGVRFCDTDMMGHINNCAIAEYAEYGRVTFFRELALAASALILVNLNIDYVAQIRVDDEVEIETWVEQIGNTSVTLRQNIYANGNVAAKTRSVVLTFDYESNRPSPVPEALRAELAPFTNADRG